MNQQARAADAHKSRAVNFSFVIYRDRRGWHLTSAEVISMIRFVCDSCGRIKRRGQEWILGLAAESIGVQSARKEINILSRWAEPQAVHPLAVHFCSKQCEEKYMNRMFGRHVAA